MSSRGPDVSELADLEKLDMVGNQPSYGKANQAWRAKAQQKVDDACMRCFRGHFHCLLDPQATEPR